MAEVPLSTMAVYSARPTVRIDGEEHARITELIIGMQLTECEGGMSALELRVSNVASDATGGADLAFEDNRVLRLGATITVYGGDENAPRELFRGTITALEAEFSQEAPPELLVLAEDALQRARMARRTAVHADVSLKDLAERLASRLGLTPRITGFGEKLGTWVQLNESDLAFLRRLLDRHDGDLQVVADELHVSPRGEVRRGALALELYGQLSRVRVIADLSHQVTQVTTGGWNAAQGVRVTGRSTGPSTGPGAGRSGARVLADALGERSEHIGHLAAATDAEAQSLAEAAFNHRAQRFVRVDGTAEGNPALRVGTHLTLTGTGPRFDNTYYVVRACHRFDVERGYQTDFEAECAFLAEA